MSLTELKSGQKARIIEIQSGVSIKRKLESLGLRIGSCVVNVGNDFLKGPVIVQHGCTQIAIGRGMAKKIIVEQK
jgi:ferrous iron transport protein A